MIYSKLFSLESCNSTQVFQESKEFPSDTVTCSFFWTFTCTLNYPNMQPEIKIPNKLSNCLPDWNSFKTVSMFS